MEGYITFYFIDLDILMLSEKGRGPSFGGVPCPWAGSPWDCLGRLRATFWLHWAGGVMKIMEKY